jgi:hypothetical protein
MSFFKKIASFLSPPTSSDTNAYWVYVKCNRCGENIRARVNLANDLSTNYEDGEKNFFCRKTLIGEGRCFERVEVELTFDKKRNLISREINGGQFISEDEFFQDQPTA